MSARATPHTSPTADHHLPANNFTISTSVFCTSVLLNVIAPSLTVGAPGVGEGNLTWGIFQYLRNVRRTHHLCCGRSCNTLRTNMTERDRTWMIWKPTRECFLSKRHRNTHRPTACPGRVMLSNLMTIAVHQDIYVG